MYFDPNEDNPGPGEYKLNYKQTQLSAPNYTIGLKSTIWFDYDKPRPGRYNVRQDENTSPKYTMAQHLKPIISTHVPGPGAYKPSLYYTNVQVPAYTIQGPTKYDPFRMIPGVGTYNVGGNLSNIAYSMGKRISYKLVRTPGPGHYNSNIPSNTTAYTIGQHIKEYQFLTPGPGAYILKDVGKTAPAFTMGQRFIHLKEKILLGNSKQHPSHQTINNTSTNTRTVSPIQAKGGRPWGAPASPPLMIAPPFLRPKLNWTRPSTWDITAPLVPNPRPRPMTSSENILRRIHFKIGPTQNEQYNEYIREMYRYMGNKGVRYGHVAKWGTSKSFIRSNRLNKSFIAKGEL